MKWPKLVHKAETPVVVEIKGTPNEYGEESTAVKITAMCNWQGGPHSTAYKVDEHYITVKGVALLDGDPFEGVDDIGRGTLTAYGVTYDIAQGTKHRNPDGSVNYCRIDVI